MTRVPPAVAFVLALIIFFAYVHPTYTVSIANIQESIKKQESALEAVDRFKKAQDALTTKKGEIPVEDLAKLESFLPDSVDNIGVVIDLTALTEDYDVELTSIDVPPPEDDTHGDEKEPVKSLNLRLSVNGSYDQFINFLNAIEHSLRILDVAEITVEGSDTGVYQFSLSMQLYWLSKL